MWHSKAMDKGKFEALATKFSEKFALSMFKKHRKFCRRDLAHLDPTPIFKNHSDNYETPCKCFYKPAPDITTYRV
jgi:hypothetical protein